MARQPDGRIVIGGNFFTVNEVTRIRIARLNVDGSLDTTFGNGQSGASDFVNVIAVQPDGRILIGGNFTIVNGVNRRFIARLNADGSLDTTFGNNLPFLNNRVFSMALQSDGKILIGGTFNTVNNVPPGGIIRLNSDGTLDATFNAGLDLGTFSGTFAIAVQPDGRILIGGEFTGVNGVARGSLARLNADGSVDTSFGDGLVVTGDSFPNVRDISLQPDGRILIGGGFNTVNGVTRNAVARLNADGSLDTSFGGGLSGVSGTVEKIARRTDGRLFVVGDFDGVNGVPRNRVARLNADGGTDSSFGQGLSGANGRINDIMIQPNDGRIVIGGIFTEFNGTARGRITRLIADCPNITVLPATIASGTSGTFYSQTFTQTGIVGTPVFSLSGTLPTGITFNSATATLSGTPTQSGTFSVTVTATDANTCPGSRVYSLTVACPPIDVLPVNPTLPTVTAGTPLSRTFTQSGITGPAAFSVSSGSLPLGVTLSEAGLLSGTPLQPGNFTFTVTATGFGTCTGSRTFSLAVVCPTITVAPTSIPTGNVGIAYGVAFSAAGGTGPYTFSATGNVPPGLTLSPSGSLTGTPTTFGLYSFTVTATDSTTCSGSVALSLQVNATELPRLYVPDTDNSRIQVFDGTTWSLAPRTSGVVGSGPGDFRSPEAVVATQTGQLFVADTGNNRIQQFTGFVWRDFATIGSDLTQVRAPQGLTLDVSGRFLFVADTGNSRILRFDTTTPGAPAVVVAGRGIAPGQVNAPRGLAIDSAGNLYVADTGNNRVQRFTGVTGAGPFPASLIASPGGGVNQVVAPEGVAVDNDANLYIADTGNSRLLLFLGGSPTAASVLLSPSQVRSPEGVAVTNLPSGRTLLVADTGNNRLLTRPIAGATWSPLGGTGSAIGQFRSPSKVR